MRRYTKIKKFDDNVSSKYQIYNSIFMTLPFEGISNTGALLLLLHNDCKEGFKKGKNPTEIIEDFFEKYLTESCEKQRKIILFRFIQYIERQVVLFDAVEDAAFPIVNNMEGLGTLQNLKELCERRLKKELQTYLREFKVRLVLTAHPTQFYPGSVLSIMTALQKSIKKNDLAKIKELLAQLGKTHFFTNKKPTPYDEAISLVWYLENVFYHAIGKINDYVRTHIFEEHFFDNELVNLGFWPGGDRDGNPFVTTKITLDVAKKLKNTILKNYYRDAKKLRKSLTFSGVYEKIINIETKLYNSFTNFDKKQGISLRDLKEDLKEIRNILIQKHDSLFLEKLDSFIGKINIFGYHFACLDLRQDSRIHCEVFVKIVECLQKKNYNIFSKNYLDLTENEQIKYLSKIKADIDITIFKDEMVIKTLGSIKSLQEIQKQNGEKGCHRYIISNNQTALNVMEVFAMLNLCGFGKNVSVDIIPLFETICDLESARDVMNTLYKNSAYRAHLKHRNNTQSIMLGFSDGTKDGGYLMANWSIFKAKEHLTKISKEFGIQVIFFDGRGGPPARGGGKTSKFYASLGPTIENKQIQLTIQGQTISSNFGNLDSCVYNIEQLLGAGISNELIKNKKNDRMSEAHRKIMDELAQTSYEVYNRFKNHPAFLPYLEHMSTLKYYGKTNIGSRPPKRSKSEKLNFKDLRAIPFVGSWSQLKQNVPGFFGVGTALKKYEDHGIFEKVKDFYNHSNFFKALLENSVMSLTKSFFELTAYMKESEKFGEFWTLIYEEFLLSKKMLLKITGYKTLMENYPDGKASIEARESIALPLLTIQQYALRMIQKLKKENENDDKIKYFEKIVTKSLFGNINASRNSA